MDSANLHTLPTRPGVYLFRDASEDVLYVGKAKSLRSRVRSYFRTDPAASLKTRELVRRIESVETIVVGSEAEALILEANLIKEHRPRFNLQLRDDKRYPYIKVTLDETFPRVLVTRRIRNDGARYFGPFTSVGPMRQALDVVKRLYTVRSCRYALPDEAPARPCLDYHIGRCRAPCVGLQTPESYGEMIDEVIRVLEGDTDEVQREAEVRMTRAASELRFEEAARHRTVMEGLDTIARQQRVQQVQGGDRDVIGVARDGDVGAAVVMKVRKGTLLGRESHRFTGLADEEEGQLLDSFTSRYYLGRGTAGWIDLPAEIIVPRDFPDSPVLAEVLSDRADRAVRIHRPARGEKKRLVELANENARHVLEEARRQTSRTDEGSDMALYELQERLDLKVVPRLILCFDISHHQGTEVVGSAVAFESGEPKRAEYRHMRIKGSWGNDDVRSMEEVVRRTLRRRVTEERLLPDLVLIDGGKAQLAATARVVEELGLSDIALAGLAKRQEEIFLPERPAPLHLSRRDPALHLLQRIRNEAHRFAISYNRKLRKRRTIRSELEEIPGVGPKRQKALLSRFGSVRGIREAAPEEIARVPGLSEGLAHRVLAYLGRS